MEIRVNHLKVVEDLQPDFACICNFIFILNFNLLPLAILHNLIIL